MKPRGQSPGRLAAALDQRAENRQSNHRGAMKKIIFNKTESHIKRDIKPPFLISDFKNFLTQRNKYKYHVHNLLILIYFATIGWWHGIVRSILNSIIRNLYQGIDYSTCLKVKLLSLLSKTFHNSNLPFILPFSWRHDFHS